MASAAEIAALVAIGLTGPTGPDDSGWHQAYVLAWDDISQTNSLWVNNGTVNNVKSVQSGIGTQYQAGDSVLVLRKQTQYLVFGKISAPGGNNANQIKSATVNANQLTSSTSFGDLATPGPSVTATVGSSRRILILANMAVGPPGFIAAQYTGGWFTLAVTGASTIVPSGTSTQFWAGGFINYETDGTFTTSQVWTVTAADGLNSGLNTFTLKYAAVTAGVNAAFSTRSITAIPF